MIVNGRGGGIRFPFTPSQWQELEQQALIFKYMRSAVPVPPHLLLFTLTTRSSTGSLRDFAHPTLPQSYSSSSVGWRCFEMGRKIDPELGRCRRTDGKKWRCSKEAFQDSKYCEKHMQRGKNRSRKPVEQQQQLPHTSSLTTTSSHTTSDKHQLHQPPAYSKLDSTTTTHLALDSASSHHRYYGNSIHRRPSMEDDDSWQLTPLAMSSINSKKTTHHHHPYFDTRSRCSKLGQGQLRDIMYDVNESRRRDEHPMVYRFLEGPPEKKDYSTSSWLNLDDKSSTTTTAQLSISIPAATSHNHVFPILSNSRHQSHHSKT